MPDNGTQYYQLIEPVHVGQAVPKTPDPLDALNCRAVTYGVKTIQARINELGYTPHLPVDGDLGPATAQAIVWAQHTLGVAADGQAGPHTLKHLLWGYVAHLAYPNEVKHAVGGICTHESGWDPGAVGFSTPDDLGLVQINGPANPNASEAQRFEYHFAYKYAADRIDAALRTPGYDIDAAIASYGYPAVAAYWVKTGTHTYPADPALNLLAVNYVQFVKDWDQTK